MQERVEWVTAGKNFPPGPTGPKHNLSRLKRREAKKSKRKEMEGREEWRLGIRIKCSSHWIKAVQSARTHMRRFTSFRNAHKSSLNNFLCFNMWCKRKNMPEDNKASEPSPPGGKTTTLHERFLFVCVCMPKKNGCRQRRTEEVTFTSYICECVCAHNAPAHQEPLWTWEKWDSEEIEQ